MADMVTPNILPDVLVRSGWKSWVPYIAILGDLNAAGGGYDFLLQASNAMCAETAFKSLKLPWILVGLDHQALAALSASNELPSSPTLRAAVTNPAGEVDVLLLFGCKDVQFDGQATCRVRANVQVAIGHSFYLPNAPELSGKPKIGETVQRSAVEVARLQKIVRQGENAARELAQMANRTELQMPTPLLMQTMSGEIMPLSATQFLEGQLDDLAQINDSRSFLPKHINLDKQTSFDVIAWVGAGVLEVPARFGASGVQSSAAIQVAADISKSTAHFTDLSHDTALLLSASDPLGLVANTTHRVRERGRVALLDEISLVGGPAGVKVKDLSRLAPEAFPCGQGTCPLTVATIIVPWHVGAPTSIRLVGESGYAVLWSEEAVAFLVRHCWETGNFQRTILQTGPANLTLDGKKQNATAESDIVLDTLKDVTLDYDSNGRTDVLHAAGSARVVPRLFRLPDGRTILPRVPPDPIFAPSQPRPWRVIATLSENPSTNPDPDIARFERAVTRGTTIRLGRPFANEVDYTVTFSRVSAAAKRIVLLAE